MSAVRDVLDSAHFVMGRQHAAFELEFAQFVGTRHAVGVANGTDALTLALIALGVEARDEVVTVANAGGYATSAIRSIGAFATYADVDETDLQMSPSSLCEVLERGRPAAVVVTHLFGNAASIGKLSALCTEAGVPLVEDCAQASGLTVSGRHVGSWGLVGTFSFYPTKNLAALGDGGAVVTSDEKVAERVRALRQYGWTAKYTVGTTHGRNSRLDEIQAAVLRVRLPDVNARNARRRAIAARYAAELNPATGRMVLNPNSVAHLAVALVTDRTAVRASLSAAGIATDVHYPVPDHQQPAWAGDARGTTLPVSEYASEHIVTLPCFPELTDPEVDMVCEAIRALA
jgi:dTDP-4-amino-4,6-dideoxygalactose transaminase